MNKINCSHAYLACEVISYIPVISTVATIAHAALAFSKGDSLDALKKGVLSYDHYISRFKVGKGAFKLDTRVFLKEACPFAKLILDIFKMCVQITKRHSDATPQQTTPQQTTPQHTSLQKASITAAVAQEACKPVRRKKEPSRSLSCDLETHKELKRCFAEDPTMQKEHEIEALGIKYKSNSDKGYALDEFIGYLGNFPDKVVGIWIVDHKKQLALILNDFENGSLENPDLKGNWESFRDRIFAISEEYKKAFPWKRPDPESLQVRNWGLIGEKYHLNLGDAITYLESEEFTFSIHNMDDQLPEWIEENQDKIHEASQVYYASKTDEAWEAFIQTILGLKAAYDDRTSSSSSFVQAPLKPTALSNLALILDHVDFGSEAAMALFPSANELKIETLPEGYLIGKEWITSNIENIRIACQGFNESSKSEEALSAFIKLMASYKAAYEKEHPTAAPAGALLAVAVAEEEGEEPPPPAPQ
jgi:hypothetical protein